MDQLNSTELSSLSTRVRAQEAQIIKSYCTGKGITLDNFMRDLALADAHLGTTLRYEGVLTIIWSSGAFMPPRNTNANAALLTHLAITSPKECLELKKALDKVMDLVFYLPPDERDCVVQHMTKHGHTEFYHGRLALRAIAIDNKWWNEEEYWRNVHECVEKGKKEFLGTRRRRSIWIRILDVIFRLSDHCRSMVDKFQRRREL